MQVIRSNAELLENQWRNEYKTLEEDLESFRIIFSMIKTCKCRDSDCRHYEKEIEKRFGWRIRKTSSMIFASGLLTLTKPIS